MDIIGIKPAPSTTNPILRKRVEIRVGTIPRVLIKIINFDRGGFKGGPGGWLHPSVKIREVRGTPLIDHQGGAGDPLVIFDIFDSGFYITYTN